MKKTSIFIIEKETALANLIRYRLMAHQVSQVRVFPAISECLSFMQKQSVPDLIVADLDLPDCNGSTFLKTVKRLFPGVRVVFLSPFTDDILLSQLMAEGASDYIFKSEQREAWIHELMKNLEYLSKVATQADQV
jgi:DNA-binding NarL/FixJ family response regulator